MRTDKSFTILKCPITVYLEKRFFFEQTSLFSQEITLFYFFNVSMLRALGKRERGGGRPSHVTGRR
jgi:hypothetical protein